MDSSSTSNVLDILKKMIKWRRKYISLDNEVEFQWSELHLSIVHEYFSVFSKTCDFIELPSAKLLNDILHNAMPGASRIQAKIAISFLPQLQEFFMVPKLSKFHVSKNCIKKYQLVEAFISFLLQLLYHKTDTIAGPCMDQISNLEKELRFLLTILGDTPFMLCDEHEEFKNLLVEFEAVANEAGSLVHSLFFSIDRAFGEINEGIDLFFDNIHLLKAYIIKFLNHQSTFSRSAHPTPKTSAVDSLLIVDSLIYDLEDLMNRGDNRLVADTKDQIQKLHQGLNFLQSSIRDIGSSQPSEIRELKEPLMRIRDLVHEAEYLIISFLVGDVPLWYFSTRLTDTNHKIELIGVELQKITKKYKFEDLKVAGYFSAQLSLQAKRNIEMDEVIVGFEDNAINILDQLVGGTERLQVVLIFGMPGLGKTTLAKKLYNHSTVNYWFDKLSWCVISQTYHRKSILTNILFQLTSTELGKDREINEEILEEHIYKTLKGWRYLIVMDDMWDSYVWDDLRRCFPDDGNGSRILFTSRNKDVAPTNSIIYAMPSLSNDQCWELMQKKVFQNKSCPPKLLEIGKKIAANCCGLPLTVVVVAGILSTMDEEKGKWEEVGGNMASYIFGGGDNPVKQILELSYKHLPEYLKPCYLYFGEFQDDEEIPVRNLMGLWISEGFIRREEGKSVETVAEDYLMELIDRSLVMVTKGRSDGGVKACTIHDSLRDLCLRKCEEENFLKFVKIDIDSMYEKGYRLRALEHATTWYYCQQVRSFHGRGLISPLYVRDMISLRVLHFDVMRFDYIGIEYLINLRYLVISDLPASIGSLVNLEYLCVETRMTIYLPPAVVRMMKLRYIQTSSEAIYDEDCSSSQTNSLEFLSSVSISELKDEEMLKYSPHLRKLKCKCKPLLSEGEVRFADLRFLTQLESLNIEFDGSRSLIDATSFPSNIKKLTLSGSNLSEMSIIGKLENLEILKLGHHGFVGERWDTRDGEFQKLRFLKMNGTCFSQWNVASSRHFPRLQRLVLNNCCYLQEIPREIGEITRLQLIEVKGVCLKSVVKSAKRIRQEQREMGNEELRVIISIDM